MTPEEAAGIGRRLGSMETRIAELEHQAEQMKQHLNNAKERIGEMHLLLLSQQESVE